MIKLQERVRRLESLIKNQSQGINSARSEALDSGSADDSEVSEDEHVFNRLQVSRERNDNLSCLSVIVAPCV